MKYSFNLLRKCAKKFSSKIRMAKSCASKNHKAKAAPPSPPPTPRAAPPSPSHEEEVHVQVQIHHGEHELCRGGDCNCLGEFVGKLWTIPGMKSVGVFNMAKPGDRIDVEELFDKIEKIPELESIEVVSMGNSGDHMDDEQMLLPPSMPLVAPPSLVSPPPSKEYDQPEDGPVDCDRLGEFIDKLWTIPGMHNIETFNLDKSGFQIRG
ncbi:uncharacterized protein [Coffea arabica]|uniref:Uncharacterized protein isoform X1 n=1 Tax=Coffea arabica TaxID=13443 RepID=A0ABM4W6K8_COFAR